jgi:hypothetical protein
VLTKCSNVGPDAEGWMEHQDEEEAASRIVSSYVVRQGVKDADEN